MTAAFPNEVAITVIKGHIQNFPAFEVMTDLVTQE
jgi:hypothetical protein